MLRRLYDMLIELAERPQAMAWLALIAFCEGFIFPIPPDVMLIPMVLAKPERWWRIAAVCALASVCGGLVGYGIGYFLMATVGHWIISTFGLEQGYVNFQHAFTKWGFWIVLGQGFTPVPFKIVTIACGAAHVALTVFLPAALATRTARFFLVSTLFRIYGAPIRKFIESYLPWVTTGFLALLIGGFLVIKFV
jgi:membrane protein YqaA with SNARE-associated domain